MGDLPADPFTREEVKAVALQEAEMAWTRLSYLRWAELQGFRLSHTHLELLRSCLFACDQLVLESQE